MRWEGYWGNVGTYVEEKCMLFLLMFKLTFLTGLGLLLLNFYIVISKQIVILGFSGIEGAYVRERQAFTPFSESVPRIKYSCKITKLRNVLFVKSIYTFLLLLLSCN